MKAMAELILPKTDTPGASDVGAGEFIDLMLTEWYDEQDRTRFLNGLSEVDQHTKDLFGKNFVEASPDQQAEILAWLGEKMTAEADALGPGRERRLLPAGRDARLTSRLIGELTPAAVASDLPPSIARAIRAGSVTERTMLSRR